MGIPPDTKATLAFIYQEKMRDKQIPKDSRMEMSRDGWTEEDDEGKKKKTRR